MLQSSRRGRRILFSNARWKTTSPLPAARKALTRFGGDEIETLVSTLHRKRMNEDEEVPPSLRRRRRAAVLSNSRVEAALWPELRVLVEEKDSELVIHGARTAALLAPDAEKVNVVASVLRVLRESPWYFKEEATGCLEARSTCWASHSSNMRLPGAARSILSDASLTARC